MKAGHSMRKHVEHPLVAASRREAGFTLIEVIVSLALLSIVSTAALYFFISGTRTVSHQQRSQNAVAVANDSMEVAYSVTAAMDATRGSSSLVEGRTRAEVEAAWALAASVGVEGLAETYPSWDPTAASSTAVLPVTRTTSLSRMEYTATTLIGTCYRLTAASLAGATCAKVPGATANPASTPVGYAPLMRIMVVVTWAPTAGQCESGTCSYQLTALVDPSADLVWNNTSQPIAVDDVAVVDVGGNVIVDVLRNDVIGPVTQNPVQKVLVKTGTGTATLQSNGSVIFRAPSNASGFMTFTYSLKDAQGRESNTATVRVSVMPRAVDDTARTAKSDAIAIPVTANDLGSPASVAVVTPPAFGTAVANGTQVVFDPQGRSGTVTFEYAMTDTSGLVSNTATVTVTVTEYRDPISADLTVQLPVTAQGSKQPIDLLALTGNPADFVIEVMSVNISKGKLHVGANEYSSSNKRGTILAFAQQGNEPGIYTFSYRVLNPDGVASEVKTVRLVIFPEPVSDTFTVVRGTTTALNVGQNDAPSNFGGSGQVAAVGTPSCGTIPATQNDLRNGIIQYTAPNRSGTCQLSYAISGTGAYAGMVSSTVTVTITVRDR